MKILAAGDLHGDTRQVKKLAEKAKKEKVDLVILCGDIAQNDKVDGMIGPFIKNKKKVVVIPGNHETVATMDFLAELYGITNLHGYSMQLGGVGLFGCGLANIGQEQLEEQEIFDILKKGNTKLPKTKKKIMVTHVHPAGTLMEKLSSFIPGSSGVSEAVKKFKPDILLCAHVHEAGGIEEKIGKTRIINPGRDGKIIEV
tara:strand:+ start:1155 stop:1754 length:600 start_codon:yes stop_codon:yes gene_type:complete